jgi:protein ImuA
LPGGRRQEGPVLWLRPAWGTEGLCPQGLGAFADPGALITVACPRAPDVLWAAEEALRSGAVALVVAELAAAPDLRQIRRLHRAAAEGVARGRTGDGRRAALGVLMMRERAESRIAGVESRWALHSLPQRSGGSAWRLERLQARDAPPAEWPLRPGPCGLAMG